MLYYNIPIAHRKCMDKNPAFFSHKIERIDHLSIFSQFSVIGSKPLVCPMPFRHAYLQYKYPGRNGNRSKSLLTPDAL